MATPNMNLTLPTPGVTPGTTAASQIVTAFETIDLHDHSSGKGVLVPTAGLNINADLTFSSFRAFSLKCTSFTSQSGALATTNKPCLYVQAGELHYIDANANDVTLTTSGSVAGTSGSIGGLSSPATAQFSSSTFIFNSTATVYGKMRNSDIELYEFTASPTNAVTLKSPASLASAYTVTFPAAVPGSTQYVSMSSTGVLSTASADTIGAAMTSTGADAVAATMTATGADAIAADMTSTGANAIAADRTRATGASVAAGGVAISASSAAFSTSSTSLVDVTNLSVTITTSGRPVQIMVVHDGGAVTGSIDAARTSTSAAAIFNILRDATVISRPILRASATGATAVSVAAPQGSINAVDIVAAGTYVYKLQAAADNAATVVTVDRCKLIAYEL